MPDRVQLNLKTANCVAVGTFNIYIIQPVYLAQMEVLSEATEVKVQADVRQPGFRFTEENTGITWQIRPDRLTVESTALDSGCGSALSRVLDRLQWTPIQAIGANAVFVSGLESAGSALDVVFQDSEVPTDFMLSQRTWHRAFKDPGGVITNLQLSASPDEVMLSLNVHTDLSKISRQLDASEAAQNACDQFRPNLERAQRLATSILPLELVQ